MSENIADSGDSMESPERLGDVSASVAMLEGYPGAALLVDANGVVLANNAKGAVFGTLMAQDKTPVLVDALTRASETSAITLCNFDLESANGKMVLEATITPLDSTGDGRAKSGMLVLIRDMTMEKNLRTTLIESRQRYKDLVEVNSDFAWEVGLNGAFDFVSQKGALRYSADEIVGKPAKEFVVSPENYQPLPFSSDVPLENVELWMVDKQGNTACMLTSCVPLFDEKQVWRGTRGVCRDVTIERANEAALNRARHREYLLNHIVFAIRDEIDPLNMLSAAATATAKALMAAGARIYRLDEDQSFKVAAEYGDVDEIDILAQSFTNMGAQAQAHEILIGEHNVIFTPTQYRQEINGVFAVWRHKDATPWEDDYRILLCDVANQLGIANEQIANHERILNLSRTDSLTGLLNRRAIFEEEAPRRIARLDREKKTAALFYLDLDNFKQVNDIHGHQAGDDVLLHTRQLMIDNSRPGDVIARLGGDEFAMWLDNISLETAQKRAEALLDSSVVLRQYSGSVENPLGISIGMALYDPETGETLDELTSRADEAMYAVKRAGKGGISVAPPYNGST